jgi:hypothetical protein
MPQETATIALYCTRINGFFGAGWPSVRIMKGSSALTIVQIVLLRRLPTHSYLAAKISTRQRR